MRRKIIVLIISIIIPLIAGVVVALYDYNVWYSLDSVEGKNPGLYASKYREYVNSKMLDITGREEDFEKQTKDRINMYRQLKSFYYSEEPIYSNDVYIGSEKLFSILIYQDLAIYAPSANVDPTDSYRYDIYIYSVNYELLKELYMDTSVLPQDKTLVEKADNPTLLINFYPDEEYNDENALFVSLNNPNHEHSLEKGKALVGSTLTSSSSVVLFDYNSKPMYNESDEPYVVQFLTFTNYSTKANLDTTGSATENNALDRFSNGAYIKIDSYITIKDSSSFSYGYKTSLLKDHISDIEFDVETINRDNYEKGFEDKIANVKIKGVLTYNMFIFTRYVWWQSLIAILGVGIIMVGFYFTFTYEEVNVKKTIKKKKKKK